MGKRPDLFKKLHETHPGSTEYEKEYRSISVLFLSMDDWEEIGRCDVEE